MRFLKKINKSTSPKITKCRIGELEIEQDILEKTTAKNLKFGLSPLFFVLKKIIVDWHKAMIRLGLIGGTQLGYRTTGKHCLAFADDVVFFTEDLQIAARKIETLKERTESTGISLGDILTSNPNKKVAIGTRTRKMDMAFRLCIIIITYKSQPLSYQAKYKHYNTVVKLMYFNGTKP